MKSVWSAVLVLSLAAGHSSAIGPHEILLLVNTNSTRSVEVANEYVRLRSVPEANVVTLGLGNGSEKPLADISPERFTKEIWNPVTRAAAERGIADHVLAWVYSLDFPIRVATNPPLSVQGLTFLRNRLPDAKTATEGTYASPLFAGPGGPGGIAFSVQSFDVQQEWFGDDMPLPSMALGYAGERGNTVPEIMRCLQTGAASDGTRPTGTVYFIVSDDVRSRCREWEIKLARTELAELGIRSVNTNAFPAGATDVLGVMMGAAAIDPRQATRYLPGAIADNLTSFGAVFEEGGQTKLTAWIAAGAVASAGAVAEPRSLWPKFPHARMFGLYGAGASVIESYYQSIRSPLQLFIAGDPLATPWGRREAVTIEGLSGQPISGTVKVTTGAGQSRFFASYLWLVDGRTVSRTKAPELELDTKAFGEGAHTLRVVAYTSGMLRRQSFAEQRFQAGGAGR